MIYLLEDDESIRKFTAYALNQSGFETVGFERPSEFYKALKEKTPRLLLLDVMLPEEDGIEVLKKLKADKNYSSIPVIMLTAKTLEYDRVVGLDSGADDYITKPFGTMELISRIKAVLRRCDNKGGECITVGEVSVDTERHSVTVSGRITELTLKEYELLTTLMKGRGKVYTRDMLLEKIWGYDYDGENRTVDVHIKMLRGKLGNSGELIKTVRGVGYRID